MGELGVRLMKTIFLAVLLTILVSACDTVHGIRRQIPVATLPSKQALFRALDSVHADSVRDVSTDRMLQFVIKRGTARTVVVVNARAPERERFVLSSLYLNTIPPPEAIEADRLLMDDTYAALRKAFPSLPSPKMITEKSIFLPNN